MTHELRVSLTEIQYCVLRCYVDRMEQIESWKQLQLKFASVSYVTDNAG